MIGRRGDRHQSAQREPWRCGDGGGKYLDCIRRAARLARLVVDIDLDQYIERRRIFRPQAVQRRNQPGAIERLQPVEMLRDFARLVRLQRADHMPLDKGTELVKPRPNHPRPFKKKLALFAERFLHVVFAERALAQRGKLRDVRRRLGLAHGDETYTPARALRGSVDARRDCAQILGDIHQHSLHSCDGLALYSRRTRPGAYCGRKADSTLGGLRMDIAELLAFSIKNKASDLHLSAGLPPMIRVDGDVRRINIPAFEHKQVHALVYDIMSDKQRRDYEEFLEVDFSFEIPSLARFRVNAFNQNRGAGAVFRTIPSEVLSLEDLGAPRVFKELIEQPQGLILCTGPTGSGKSTTLAAMVDHINKNEYGHILTIEDPIEFVHTAQRCLINQREVHRDTHGFNEALRSALREDPDYVLVGEMRDIETIRLALTAAETGHLVFATLHTSSAAKTIDRIIDVFPAGEKPMVRSMLSESLRAVISQSLLKKVGGGRIAAHEIMVGIPAIRNLIREDKVAQMYSSIQTGSQYGMQTLDQCLQDLVKRGLVTRQQAIGYAKNKEIFK